VAPLEGAALLDCGGAGHGPELLGMDGIDHLKVRRYMTQPLVEVCGGCMVVLKVSWCGIVRKSCGRTRPSTTLAPGRTPARS
jgi:hypothetical protein